MVRRLDRILLEVARSQVGRAVAGIGLEASCRVHRLEGRRHLEEAVEVVGRTTLVLDSRISPVEDRLVVVRSQVASHIVVVHRKVEAIRNLVVASSRPFAVRMVEVGFRMQVRRDDHNGVLQRHDVLLQSMENGDH